MSIINEQRAPAIVGRIRQYFPQVNRVADSTKPLIVCVKPCDISSAKSKKEDDCAMAHALERQEKCDGAIVRSSQAWIIRGDLAVKYAVPPSLSREIVSFDRHHDFREGTYQLSPVPKSHLMSNKHKRRDSAKRSHVRTRKDRVRHVTEGIRGVKPKVG